MLHWVDLLAVVTMGLAGSGHCAGMCGGFALAIGRGAPNARALAARHAAYQAGKALTYVFLAVLAATGFGVLARVAWFASAQMVLSLAAGGFMVVYGLAQILEWRVGAWWQRTLEPLPGCRSLAAVARTPGLLAAFVTGWLNGFIPCGLVVTMVLYLAGLDSIVAAGTGAVAFGAATFPGLFLFGLVAHGWSPRWRRGLVRLAGVLLVLFGGLTMVRAFPEGRAAIMRLRGVDPPPAMEGGAPQPACCGH